MFEGASREAFRAAVGGDPGMWARARGWALWKAMLVLCSALDTDPVMAAEQRRIIAHVLSDHLATA